MVTKAEIERFAREQGLPGQGLLDFLTRTDELLIANLMMLRELTDLLKARRAERPGGPITGPAFPLAPALGIRTESIISGYQARSTEVVNPGSLAKCHGAIRVVVIVNNALDQDVTYEILGNTSESSSGAFVIASGTATTLTSAKYQLAFEDWMPYVGVRVTPSVAPTAGSIDATVIIQEWG